MICSWDFCVQYTAVSIPGDCSRDASPSQNVGSKVPLIGDPLAKFTHGIGPHFLFHWNRERAARYYKEHILQRNGLW